MPLLAMNPILYVARIYPLHNANLSFEYSWNVSLPIISPRESTSTADTFCAIRGRILPPHFRPWEGIYSGSIEEAAMAQKVIEIVGSSKESFAKAAENAVAEAAKTVRGMKWARVTEFEMLIDGKKIAEYRATARIYFEIER